MSRVSVSQRPVSLSATGGSEPPTPEVSPARWPRRADLVVAALSVAVACWVTAGLWADPGHRAIAVNAGDQALFEWLLAYAATALTGGHNPLFADLLNVPDGVNLAVNTASTVLGLLLAPITLTLGPPVAFTVALTFNLAASGFAWYLLLSRRLGLGPIAAAVGGLFCGFAPGVVSHANAHLNFTALWLLPLVIAKAFDLHRPGRWLRGGVLLGVLVTLQYSLGAELLFFAALACAVFLAGWLLAGHREPREHVVAFVRGLGVTTVVAGTLLAYPIWLQFAGPQTYHGTGFDQRIHSEAWLAWLAYPQRSLAGVAGLDTNLAPNPTEENSFFSGLLLLVVVVAVILLRRRGAAGRRAMVTALAATGVIFMVLSFGPVVKIDREVTDTPMPYALLAPLPFFDAALPARLALVVVPVIGILLALTIDALGRLPRPRRRLAAAAVALALLPLVPVPLLTIERSAVPRFISAGTWREYVRPGETLVPVPPPSDLLPDGQRWQATALAASGGEAFRIPAGFFLGPGGPDGRGQIGPVPRPTYEMLTEVALSGGRPEITDVERRQAHDDLRFWRASVVVLPDPGIGDKWSQNHGDLLATLTALFGPGTRVEDVRVWRVTAAA